MLPVIGPILAGIKVATGLFVAKQVTDIAKNSGDIAKGAKDVGEKIAKGTKKVIDKTIETTANAADFSKTKYNIFILEKKINECKYNIGTCIVDNEIKTNDKDIEHQLEKIKLFLKDIKDLMNEYSILNGNVDELKKEIIKNNKKFEILEKEKGEVIDCVELIKSEVGEGITGRHKEAEEYIRKVMEDTKAMKEEVDCDNLLEELDKI